MTQNWNSILRVLIENIFFFFELLTYHLDYWILLVPSLCQLVFWKYWRIIMSEEKNWPSNSDIMRNVNIWWWRILENVADIVMGSEKNIKTIQSGAMNMKGFCLVGLQSIWWFVGKWDCTPPKKLRTWEWERKRVLMSIEEFALHTLKKL
jgi:hypothetical protein